MSDWKVKMHTLGNQTSYFNLQMAEELKKKQTNQKKNSSHIQMVTMDTRHAKYKA